MSVQSVFVAKERLKNLLISDRMQCTPDAAERLTKDLYLTVSKYMEIEGENFELQIDAMDNSKTVLNLSIPVVRPKTDEEIDANIKEQELKTQKKAQEIVKELEGLIKERTQALIDGKIDPDLLEEATKKASIENDEEESEEEIKETSKAQEETDKETDKEDTKEENKEQTPA